jgi:single-stranded DNA-specific DHH superfamily exonuclease
MLSWVSGLSEKTLALGSSVNRGNPPPVFLSDRLEAERGNGFFQRRIFGG